MERKCTVNDCNRKHRAKGMCAKHYYATKGYGKNRGPGPRDFGVCIVDNCETKAGPTGACRNHWHKVNNPNKNKLRNLFMSGITLEQYETMLSLQDYCCKICGSKAPGGRVQMFAVDHDHNCCNKKPYCGDCVRGLLCSRCNLTLGGAWDDSTLLRKMADYIESNKRT